MEIKPRDPNKKCICKKCEECHHFRDWNFDKLDRNGKPTGLKELLKVCSFDVLYDVIPGLIGSVDGCQQAANETYNKVDAFGQASVKTLKQIAKTVPKLLK